jgi:hypothetical protein
MAIILTGKDLLIDDGKNYFSTSPQDIDECALKIHNCQQNCFDGWFPVLSYTCSCNNGIHFYCLNLKK